MSDATNLNQADTIIERTHGVVTCIMDTVEGKAVSAALWQVQDNLEQLQEVMKQIGTTTTE